MDTETQWRAMWADGCELLVLASNRAMAAIRAARARIEWDGKGTWVNSQTDGDEEARLQGAVLRTSLEPVETPKGTAT